MTATTLFIEERGDDGVVRLTLNRPGVHNAFDDTLIDHLANALERLAADEAVRALVVTGSGKSFSAGADIGWMRRSADYGFDENLADAGNLARMLRALNDFPRPTLALVNGAAIGGGVGLVASCDIAIAADQAVFSLAEVRLGIIPAVISPYVVAAIGPRQARRYFLTGERMSAAEAKAIGLVHDVVPSMYLETAGQKIIEHLLKGGPAAQAAAKRLVADVADRPIDDALADMTARRIAEVRATDEAREGLSAFLEKRKPGWGG